MDPRGSVVVVTGASAGIGRATALAFAGAGSNVVVAARRKDRLDDLAGRVRERGVRALAVACDVGDRAQVEALAEATRAEFGRADVLVNNAGVPGGGPFADVPIERAEDITRVNYLGVLYGTKAFLPMMLEGGRGHVVNVASLAGRFAVPGSAVYSATKHAVVALSEALYFELRPRGIVVTVVNPGLVRTEGFPHEDARGRRLPRVMEPERIADVIVDVVRRGKGPEVSVPRWLAAMQAFRVVTPGLYHFGLRRATSGALRPTRMDEARARPPRPGDGEPGP